MSEELTGILILPGHAIYHEGVWHGGERGGNAEALKDVFAGHVSDACEIYRAECYKVLCLSGGKSRPKDESVRNVSEAQGLCHYIGQNKENLRAGDIQIIEERWARDSFENVFFSLLAYHHEFGEWPQRVGVVSWKYKALRFYVAAVGLNIGDLFTYYGSGDPADQEAVVDILLREAANLQHIIPAQEIVDPLHRNPWFYSKRQKRTPDNLSNEAYLKHVKSAYPSGNTAINCVEASDIGAWQGSQWPWLKQGH